MAGPILRLSLAALALILVALAGCASVPSQADADADTDAGAAPQQIDTDVGAGVARYALEMVGAPYRYGGNTPQGFDCSGLVQYSYALAGMQLPRDMEGLWARTHAISIKQIRPGDLLFFRLGGKRNSHVGLYIGNGSFVHAPSTGKRVSTESLSNPYWRPRLSGTRRPFFKQNLVVDGG